MQLPFKLTFSRTNEFNAAMSNTLQKNSLRPTTASDLRRVFSQHLIDGIGSCVQFIVFRNHQGLTGSSIIDCIIVIV